MSHLNKKYYVWILATVSIFTYLISAYFFPILKDSFIGYIRLISIVVAFNLMLIFFFNKYFWKWKYFYDWFVPFPNLNGTWRGEIKSTWEDSVIGQRPNPILVILTINQSFFSISCVMRTKEMESYSFTSDFVIDKGKQILRIVYSYNSIPKQTVKYKSPQHYGTMILDIKNQVQKLTGDYWTDRKTAGNIDLTFWKKERLDNFPDDIVKHSVSDIRNKDKQL